MKKPYKKPEIRKPTKRRLEKIVASLIGEANKFEELALIDELTSVYNKRAYKRRLEEEKSIKSRNPDYDFSYIQIDINEFKKLNDTYGHLAGDHVLATAANILKESVRITDGVYRIGGDEFAVVCSNQKIEAAESIAKRAEKSIEKFVFSYGGVTLPVRISIGTSQYNGSIDKMIEEADMKMYVHKRRKRKGL